MNFYNVYPPESIYDPKFDESENQGISASLRVEHMSSGFKILKKDSTFSNYLLGFLYDVEKEYFCKIYLKFSFFIPRFGDISKALNTGKSSTATFHSYSCKTAWMIYEHFKQDFICLGYELPPECLKDECKST